MVFCNASVMVCGNDLEDGGNHHVKDTSVHRRKRWWCKKKGPSLVFQRVEEDEGKNTFRLARFYIHMILLFLEVIIFLICLLQSDKEF